MVNSFLLVRFHVSTQSKSSTILPIYGNITNSDQLGSHADHMHTEDCVVSAITAYHLPYIIIHTYLVVHTMDHMSSSESISL